jgi:hypothetical protein
MTADVEQFGKDLSDEDLARITLANESEETAVGALKELIRRRSPLLKQVIPQILQDPAQTTAARSTAVNALGRGRLEEAPQILMENLDGRNPRLFAKMVNALGRTGNESALNQLEQMEGPKDPVAMRALDFARVLLSYRMRMDRHRLPVPDETSLLEVEDGIMIQISQARPKSLAAAIHGIREELPGIDLSEESALTLTCQTNELLLAFVKGFDAPDAIQSLRERSAMPLVLLKKANSLEYYALDTIFLTQPMEFKDEVALLGIRPSGELIYSGRVEFSEQQTLFRLRSLASRSSPAVELDGFYDARTGSLEITRAISSPRLARDLQTKKIPQRAVPGVR